MKKRHSFLLIFLILLCTVLFYTTANTLKNKDSFEPESAASATVPVENNTSSLDAEPQTNSTSTHVNETKNDKPNDLHLEIPLCPRDCLLISEDDTKGVLETPEKEDSHQIIRHAGFTLCYREKYEQAEWVAYTLDSEKIQKNVERKDNFRSDPKVLTGSATPADYKKSGYDRGHLAPSADMTYSFETMDESFFMSNMSPQKADFNRGLWKDLEHEVRCLAERFDLLYIVTGPVLDKAEFNSIGKNCVAVPDFYYKAILGVRNDAYFAIGFILPNEKCEGTIWDYAVSVDEVENRTFLDFFYLLEDDAENKIEESFELSDWMVENE